MGVSTMCLVGVKRVLGTGFQSPSANQQPPPHHQTTEALCAKHRVNHSHTHTHTTHHNHYLSPFTISPVKHSQSTNTPQHQFPTPTPKAFVVFVVVTKMFQGWANHVMSLVVSATAEDKKKQHDAPPMLDGMFGSVANLDELFGHDASYESSPEADATGDDSCSESDDDNDDDEDDHQIPHPHLEFTAPNEHFDYATATEWRVLDPINNAEDRELIRDTLDPITHEPLLEEVEQAEAGGAEGCDEAVVQLPCHSDAIPCLMFMNTAKRCLTAKAECPTCKYMFGHKIPGSQPSGRMNTRWTRGSCAGHPEVGTIVITYSFEDGEQGAHHQSPGEYYSGAYRQAYLPDNEVGRRSLSLLLCAFMRGELFTVGTSLTNGCTNTTVWGSIHQKTSMHGGCHGYPDDGYFERLAHECAAKGIFAFSAKDEVDQAAAVRAPSIDD
jgi:deltex-like protein